MENTALQRPQSLPIGALGVMAAPLLSELISLDGTASSINSTKSTATEQPRRRLLSVVTSMSAEAFSAAVSDIGSIVCLSDRMAGSLPGNSSRGAKDLAMEKASMQQKNSIIYFARNKIRHDTSAMPLNAVSSAGNLTVDVPYFESAANSGTKRPRVEANHAYL